MNRLCDSFSYDVKLILLRCCLIFGKIPLKKQEAFLCKIFRRVLFDWNLITWTSAPPTITQSTWGQIGKKIIFPLVFIFVFIYYLFGKFETFTSNSSHDNNVEIKSDGNYFLFLLFKVVVWVKNYLLFQLVHKSVSRGFMSHFSVRYKICWTIISNIMSITKTFFKTLSIYRFELLRLLSQNVSFLCVVLVFFLKNRRLVGFRRK